MCVDAVLSLKYGTFRSRRQLGRAAIVVVKLVIKASSGLHSLKQRLFIIRDRYM